MTGIDLNEAGTLNRPAGIIVVDGQDTTTALVVAAVTDMVALVPPATQSCVSSILWHTRVRDDPGLLWLRALSENRLTAPNLSARP